MAVTLFDARSGALAELRPAAPPKVLLCLGPSAGAREEHVHRLLWRVLEHAGFTLSRLMAVDENASRADASVAGSEPKAGLWVRPEPVAAKELPEPQARRDKGFLEADFHLLMVKTHYRAPVRFSWEALAAAREERLELASIAKSLAGAPAEASSSRAGGLLAPFQGVPGQGSGRGGGPGRPLGRAQAGGPLPGLPGGPAEGGGPRPGAGPLYLIGPH
jgi:hypothetical protein